MDDKSALLGQLRIDRNAQPSRSGYGRLWFAGIAAALIAAPRCGSGCGLRVYRSHCRGAGGDPGECRGGIDLGCVGIRGGAAPGHGRVKDYRQNGGTRHRGRRTRHGKSGHRTARRHQHSCLPAQAAAQLNFARAGLEETQVNLANAQRDYDRQTSLLAGHFVSQSAVDNAQTTLDALRAQLATQRRNVEVAERGVNVADRNLDDTVYARPSPASSRSRQLSPAKSSRPSRRAAVSPAPASAPSSTWIRSRSGRRQRKLHQPRATCQRRGQAQRLSGLADSRARHRGDSDRRSQ